MVQEEHQKTDREILVAIALKCQTLATDMCWVKKQLSNHLKHHWMVELALIAAVAALIAQRIWG